MTVERRPDYFRITKEGGLIPHIPRRTQGVVTIGYPTHIDQSESNERQPLIDKTIELDPTAEINDTPSKTEI